MRTPVALALLLCLLPGAAYAAETGGCEEAPAGGSPAQIGAVVDAAAARVGYNRRFHKLLGRENKLKRSFERHSSIHQDRKTRSRRWKQLQEKLKRIRESENAIQAQANTEGVSTDFQQIRSLEKRQDRAAEEENRFRGYAGRTAHRRPRDGAPMVTSLVDHALRNADNRDRYAAKERALLHGPPAPPDTTPLTAEQAARMIKPLERAARDVTRHIQSEQNHASSDQRASPAGAATWGFHIARNQKRLNELQTRIAQIQARVVGVPPDPRDRLAELARQKAAIEAEIALLQTSAPGAQDDNVAGEDPGGNEAVDDGGDDGDSGDGD